MTYFKNYIILFGGFQDTSQQTKYLNDLWIYDTNKFTWHQPALPPASAKPDARSSFSFLPHDSGAVLYGGYSRTKVSVSSSKPGKGLGKGTPRITTRPLIHQDSWYLRITSPTSDAPSGALPTVRWERRKRPVNAPNPPPAGATMTFHKGRGICFGGVHDIEESEEGMESEFFNNLLAYNIDRNRFFQLGLRKPRTSAKKIGSSIERGKRGRGKADEEELLRNLALIEGKGLADIDALDVAVARGDDGDDEETERIEKPVQWEMPHPRFNAQLTVQEDVLYIYGGTFEKDDREYTFDEMWAIDLGKLDGCKEIFKREISDWHGSEDEDDSDEEDESSDETEDERVGESSRPGTPASPLSAVSREVPVQSEAVDPEPEKHATPDDLREDQLPHPRPFEALREFFVRTSNEWQAAVLEWQKYQREIDDLSIKEIRKMAFERAEKKWWDCREEIQALEDEQEAAGIGEIVCLDQKGGEGGVAGRRR